MKLAGGVKKVHETEEEPAGIGDVLLDERGMQMRMEGLKRKFGSENRMIATSVTKAKDSASYSRDAIHSMFGLNGIAVEVVEEEVAEEVAVEVADGSEHAGICQCDHQHEEKPVWGTTRENAYEIDDDDDDLTVMAFRSRPLLPKLATAVNEGGKFRDEAILTAEEISGHQKVIHDGMLAAEDETLASTTGNFLIRKGLKEAKAALKSLKTKARARKLKPKADEAPKVAKVEECNVEEEPDDVVESMFLSPRHKKTRDVKYVEADENGPDYEINSDSDFDRENTPEPVDPFDDIWNECYVMARQSKREDDEGEIEVCEHSFEIKNDVGRACVLCGLIKEDIKDMSFRWRKPLTVRKTRVAGERTDTWDGDGDGVLEEEAQLVAMAPLEAHPFLESQMHPHQVEGFKFLSRNLVEENSGGCMLAFAPGTGKSFLIICFIQSFMVQAPNARPMIIAPKSMLRPWMQEFKKWAVEETTVLNLYEAENQVAMLKEWQETRSVLLVGYSQCTNMSGEVGRYLTEGPGLVVLDEGHLARTESTKISKSLSRVHTTRRVLLSGTPFNNNFEEFYTMLELVRPNFMMRANPQMCPTLNTLITPDSSIPLPVLKKSSNAGRQAFKDVIGERFESGEHGNIKRALKDLRKLIEPFVLWHKGQILETLPGITDLTITLELTPPQQELLNSCNSEVRDTLQKRASAIYLHPVLEPVAEGGKRSQNDPRLNDAIDVTLGAKLRWVLDLIQFCNDVKEKVLIFSEYLYSLQLIENQAARKLRWSRDRQILRLDGKLPPHEREKIIEKFNNDPEARMLCASIKACGEGISLVGASRVVILEVVWNHAVMKQAISRAFRIGQQKKVVVYRLIAAGTFEEQRIHALATRKEWLAKLLFDPSVSCVDPTSILWDVMDDCSDSFLKSGPLRVGVKKIYEREF